MAVIDPGSLSPTDTRPIFDQAHQPGGPWHRYRSNTWVDAIYIATPWLRRRASDGMLVEMDPCWIMLDQQGNFSITDQTTFAGAWTLLD